MALKLLYPCPDYWFFSTFKTSPSFISQSDTSSMNTTVHSLQGNSDFETTLAVKILLTGFLLTSESVPYSVSKDGGCWIKLYFCRNQKTANPAAGAISSWCWYRPSRPTLCRSPTISCCAHCSGRPSVSVASLLKHFYQDHFSTAKLSLYHHRGRTVPTFTTNLAQEKDYLCRFHICKQRSREITFSAQCTFFILLALNSFVELSWVIFLPHFHLQIMGEGYIPWRKKIKQAQASALLHTLLAFGSLQQIHKAHHTINLELQTFRAMVFLSLPVDQE